MPNLRIVFACTVASLCVGTGAHGAPATASSDDESSETATEIAEIVVTATKRDTKLQETPIAITVLTAEAIEQQRLYNFADIAMTTPGLIFTPHSPTLHASYSHRRSQLNLRPALHATQ